MLQGHTLHAVLTDDVRTTTAFGLWSFVRGLTSCIFLLLSGFVFVLATHHRWGDHLASRAVNVRRFRRFGFFLLLGYALHFPVAHLSDLSRMTDERWQSFMVVDVLQCVAVTLASLQVLVWLARTPRYHTFGAAAGCVALVLLTPLMWRTDWSGLVPRAIAAYLSPAAGSPFPLFPWGGYILLGAVLGSLYVRSGPRELGGYATQMLIGGGIAMLGVAFVGSRVPLQPFGATDFWSTSPNQFLLRSGLVLLLLGGIAHASRRVHPPMFAIHALAQESLTIYAVHLYIVYGSAWNLGLRQRVGPTQTLLPALGYVAAMWVSMTLLACGWYSCKHRQPGVARWIRVGVAALLFGSLLL